MTTTLTLYFAAVAAIGATGVLVVITVLAAFGQRDKRPLVDQDIHATTERSEGEL